MKRYFKAFGYLLSVHVLALLVMTLFRLVEFIALHGMIVDAEASRVMAFVKGVWFDNVIACYISVLPVAVLLIAASLGWCHRRLLRGINIWYAAWFAIAFMPSAANTPYFQYFFKNINSSIFGWFGYVATTSGMLLQVDVMPTLFGLMNLNYEYEGFGVDLLKQQRPMVFYSADNQIVARDHQRCFVYNPSMNRSFCYDVLPNGNLKETKQESKFQDLKNYVFSNIQAAEYIERHQQ